MESLISVVIPVYNVKDYLEKCVKSVISQTYKNIEIILVDDGSTDGSQFLCDSLKELDDRVIVYHKTNGGLSDARNYGFERTNGQFIFFLDSDDWISEDALEILYSLLTENNADIAVANYFYQYDTQTVPATKLEKNLVFNKNEAMKELLRNNYIKNFAWGKLYRKKLLEKHMFPVGKLFEDTYWTHLVFDEADKVVLSKKELVYYLQRTTSISYTFNIKKLDIIDGYLERREFIKKHYNDLLYIVDENIISLLIGLYCDSLRHFSFQTHKIIKEKLVLVSRNLRKEFNKSNQINKAILKQFNVFDKHKYIYIFINNIKKVKSKILNNTR